MSVTITWRPNPPADNIVDYVLNSSTTSTGPWTLVYLVPATQSGPYWNASLGLYTYTDTAGSLTTWYQLLAINNVPESSFPSASFQATSPTPPIPSTVAVNHNYPTPGNLRYQTPSGHPIEGAIIRAYTVTDYALCNFNSPQGTTFTDQNGNWIDTMFLTTGYTYTIQFFKDGLFGPDSVNITI